jgi:hypothetical protein
MITKLTQITSSQPARRDTQYLEELKNGGSQPRYVSLVVDIVV